MVQVTAPVPAGGAGRRVRADRRSAVTSQRIQNGFALRLTRPAASSPGWRPHGSTSPSRGLLVVTSCFQRRGGLRVPRHARATVRVLTQLQDRGTFFHDGTSAPYMGAKLPRTASAFHPGMNPSAITGRAGPIRRVLGVKAEPLTMGAGEAVAANCGLVPSVPGTRRGCRPKQAAAVSRAIAGPGGRATG